MSAQVPPGVLRVTLEGRDRLGPGGWQPRAVTRLDGAGGEITLRLPRSASAELMRVRADATDPLPSAFYGGTNTFYEAGNGAFAGPMANDMFEGRNDAATPGAAQATREVVESDIWKIRGRTLYFFNQLRGLQVIDITNPDAASIRGTLELPAAGEDLYLLGDSHVVLLAQNGCSYNESQVVVVAEVNGTPSVAARLPVTGYIVESRLIGTALYVAAQSYRPVAGAADTTWEWGTLVSSYDLSNPTAPQARGTLWYSGYGHVVQATDRLLFVVTQDPSNWWQSIIRSIDISNPDGTMRAYESIRTAGRVHDKFKLRWVDGILTTISEDWRTVSGQRVTTRLETFRLADPQAAGSVALTKLGDLELGHGEQLHATRFDGSRVYIVTFFRIDPLWVVDLSNPAAPRISGSIDVPGWSTFIQPLGNQLVTIGVEGSRVAVSLFGVANPAAPTLISRVLIGEKYSFSEANWDEKAFSVLPAAGLIMVPFSGDTASNGYASSVQLVDLKDDSLVARGIIQHQFQPRRATLHDSRVLSISGEELLSVDISNRDEPQVKGETVLAWAVDRVFLAGDFLVEIGGSRIWGWGNPSPPVLRVTPASAPNQVVGHTTLSSELPVIGAAQRGQQLYVLQGQSDYYPIPLAENGETRPAGKAVLSVIDLSELPALEVTGETEADTGYFGYSGNFQAVWPKEDVLVFSGGGFNFWWDCFNCGIPMAADIAVRGGGLFWPGYGGGGGQLLAFDVANHAAPSFASYVDLATNGWWSFSEAFASDGLVYLSHQTSFFVVLDKVESPATPDADLAKDPAQVGNVIFPSGTWVSRSFLNVVDYASPKDPLVRKPVNVPGRLQGLSHSGAVLYTTGTRWKENQTDWTEYLDASAYDGVSAQHIDSLALSSLWPHTVLVSAGNIFIGRPDEAAAATEQTGNLETWRLSDEGKFTRLGNVTLQSPANQLGMFDGLLAAQQNNNTVVLFDASNAAALRPVGEGSPSGCLWFNLKHADGELSRGLWLPLGPYGVASIPAQP